MIRTGIPAERGTYVLVLACGQAGRLRVGRLGSLDLRRGFYLYVGSALGPGGLAARLAHHCRIAKRPHWHVDYLRAAGELIEVWYATGAARREHQWAGTVARLPGATLPMPGFGSSGCPCRAHLFWFQRRPSIIAFNVRCEPPLQGGLQTQRAHSPEPACTRNVAHRH